MNYANNKDKINRLFIFQVILSILIIFFNIFNQSKIASVLFNLEFIVLLAMLGEMILSSKFNMNEIKNIILLILILSFAFTFVLSGSNIVTFNYLKKVIFFSCALIFFYSVTKVVVNKKTIQIILTLNILLAILYILNYCSMPKEYIAGGLTFNYTNPNLTGMWLIHTAMYLLLGVFFYKNKLLKLVCIILASTIIYFIYETGARTTLISITIFILLILYFLVKKKVKLSKFLTSFLIVVPLIFAFVYMTMIDNKTINMFGFMESEGKTLTSRYGVWSRAFDSIKENLITGDYYGISYGTGMSQMHNSHIDILASYGVLVFILFVIYIISIVNGVNNQCKNRFQILSLIAFLIVIVMGIGEAALFVGSLGMYVSTGGFLLLARYGE